MTDLDKQIAELQKQKMQQDRQIINEKNKELRKFAETLKGKYFKFYTGTNMCGQSYFSYHIFTKLDILSSIGGEEIIYAYGHGVHVSISFPSVYKGTYYDRLIVDYEYGKRCGSDSFKSHTQGTERSGITLTAFMANKKKDVEFNISTIEKQNFTPYGYQVEIKSKEAFEHKYKECSKEEYHKVLEVCNTTNNYIFEQLYDTCFNGNISKHAFDSDHILSVTSKEKADEILEKVDFIYNKIKDLNTHVTYDFIKDLIKQNV